MRVVAEENNWRRMRKGWNIRATAIAEGRRDDAQVEADGWRNDVDTGDGLATWRDRQTTAGQ